MIEQFHEGQEVAVLRPVSECIDHAIWRKAKIIRGMEYPEWHGKSRVYDVQFHDGARAVFDAEHIKAIDSPSRAAAKKVAHEFGERLMGRHP